jgi:hypothetical protein
MVDMSRDGILLKRFVLGDPYQSLTLWDLVRTSLWKLAVFYVYVGAIFWMGLRTPRGRSALVISLVALVPMLYFALVLLEPSSPERFLPVLPFMLLTMAAGWQGAGRSVVAGFAMALPLLNGPAFIEAWPRTSDDVAAQMQDVTSHASPRDLVVTVTFADPMAQWMEQRVFHPSLSRGRPSHVPADRGGGGHGSPLAPALSPIACSATGIPTRMSGFVVGCWRIARTRSCSGSKATIPRFDGGM